MLFFAICIFTKHLFYCKTLIRAAQRLTLNSYRQIFHSPVKSHKRVFHSAHQSTSPETWVGRVNKKYETFSRLLENAQTILTLQESVKCNLLLFPLDKVLEREAFINNAIKLGENFFENNTAAIAEIRKLISDCPENEKSLTQYILLTKVEGALNMIQLKLDEFRLRQSSTS